MSNRQWDECGHEIRQGRASLHEHGKMSTGTLNLREKVFFTRTNFNHRWRLCGEGSVTNESAYRKKEQRKDARLSQGHLRKRS